MVFRSGPPRPNGAGWGQEGGVCVHRGRGQPAGLGRQAGCAAL